jgi:MGT family glycosyltransferase
MGKAVFLNVSGGGHVIATYGMVGELVSRGEEIIYYESPRFKEEIEALGAVFRPYPDIQPYEGPMVDYPYHHELGLSVMLTWCSLEWIPKLIDEIRELKPDYIVHDSLCLWGRIIAGILKVPAICSIHTPAFTWRVVLANRGYWMDMPEMFFKSLKCMLVFRKLERKLRKTYNLTPISFMDTFTNPQGVNICHTPAELQPNAEALDKTYHFVGSVHTRPSDHNFPLEKLRDKLIYIGFGTICDPGKQFFLDCLEAFRDSEYQVLVNLSASTEPNDLKDVPDNFIIWSLKKDGLLPQLDVLSKTDLFIMNGGMGGARESAWYAVPMLAVPTTFETDLNSIRIAEQHAGIRLKPGKVTPQTLRKNANKILSDPSYRNNSKRIGDACRNSGGAKRAADIILDYVNSRTSFR